MEIFKPLSPVIPVFLLVAVGFVFAHWKKISLASVTEIIVYLGTPSLVFTSLASRPLFAGDIAVLVSGESSRRRRHQPASVIALRFPTRSCHELHSHRKVWSGSESRGVRRCLEYFFFCHHDSAGLLADPLRRRSFSTDKMNVVKCNAEK